MARALFFLAFLALPGGAASADILILKDGTVLECRIRDLKIPNPNSPGVFTVIAEVDEEGTLKQFHSSELRKEGREFALYRGKTSWERRAEYRKEFDRRKTALRETWESHAALSRWCRSHLLPDEAEEHARAAWRLRSGKAPASVEERVKLARWCERELGLAPEAALELKAALDLRRAAAAGDELEPARWAESVELLDEAAALYAKVLEREPDHAAAGAALRRIRESPEFAGRRLAAELARDGRAWKLTVAVQDAAGREFLESWKRRMEELSAFLFTLTEGQFFIAEVEIEDKVQEGTIVVEKGKLDWRGLDGRDGKGVLGYCRTGLTGYQVHVGGLVPVSALAHEVCHGAFGLPDEYPQEPMCDCLMRSAPNPQKLCDSATHAGGGGGCWGRIQARYRKVKHPNPAWKILEKQPDKRPPGPDDGARVSGELDAGGVRLSSPPPPKITILDN